MQFSYFLFKCYAIYSYIALITNVTKQNINLLERNWINKPVQVQWTLKSGYRHELHKSQVTIEVMEAKQEKESIKVTLRENTHGYYGLMGKDDVLPAGI